MIGRALFLLAVATPLVVQAGSRKHDDRASLALLNVTNGSGFTDQQVGMIEEVLLSALDRTDRFAVTGQTDIDAMLSLEAKKQAAGCSSDGCMAEIAAALGVDYVASATVGRLGKLTILSLKVIDVHAGSVLVHARRTIRRDTDLVTAADAIAAEVAGRMPQRVAPATQPPIGVAPPPSPAGETGLSTQPSVQRAAAAEKSTRVAPSPSVTRVATVTGNTSLNLAPSPLPTAVPEPISPVRTRLRVSAYVLTGLGAAAAVVGGVLTARFVDTAHADSLSTIYSNQKAVIGSWVGTGVFAVSGTILWIKGTF